MATDVLLTMKNVDFMGGGLNNGFTMKIGQISWEKHWDMNGMHNLM